jgi:hypothetical protein
MNDVRRKVLEVYAAVDAAIAEANPRCERSGRCCRFTEYGHTLFISHFEAEILLESATRFVQPVSRDGCPSQVEGLCTVGELRPLACRIYFCDPTFAEKMVEITESSIASLKSIADEHGIAWHYAPLHDFLNSHHFAEGPTPPVADSMTSPDTRHSLLVLPNRGE